MFLEPNFNGPGIVILIFSILLGPPLVLSLIALALRKNYPKVATAFVLLAVLYLIVGLGMCFGGF